MDLLIDIQIAGPDALLAATGLTGLLLGALFGDKFGPALRFLCAIALAAAAALAFGQVSWDPLEAFGGLYKITPFVAFAKAVGYAVGAVSLGISGGFLKTAQMERYEYALLTVFAAMGSGVMLSSNDLMTLYMGIETLSLSSYVLAAFQRDNVKSAEAGLKYFVLGALASGLLLYGSSLIYGYAGGTRFEVIAQAPYSVGLIFGLVLLICGLAFKASAAPFHVWTPDVYEGAPAPVVAFFATAPKIASVALFCTIMFTVFGAQEASWKMIVAIISAASMLIGAFGALMQNSIKRILAYSSISNVGFALIGVAAGERAGGAAAVLVYMTIYVVATLGTFAAVMSLRRKGRAVDDVSDLNGLAKLKPGLAFGLLVLIFSVAGIPPAVGFWGKLQVFTAGIQADILWLVLVGCAASVVSLGYYLRLVWAMYMKPPGEAMDSTELPVAGAVLLTTVMIFPVGMILIQTLLSAAAGAGLG